MIQNRAKGVFVVTRGIPVPFNENTAGIYEVYVKVAKEILQRSQWERNGGVAIGDSETQYVEVV